MFDIGLQMFSFYHMERESLAKCIRAAAKIGYTKIELAGFFDLNAESVKALCDELGIRIHGTHSGIDLLKPENIGETIRQFKVMDCKNFTIPSYRFDEPERREYFVKVVNEAQPMLEAEGIRLQYHNHSTEFMFPEGTYSLYDELAERTKIGFQIDTYHAFAIGLDPIEVMKRYDGRITCTHIRDGLGYQLEAKALGDGKCPVIDCVNYSLEKGFDMIVENASWEPDAVSEAQRCYDYLKKHFA